MKASPTVIFSGGGWGASGETAAIAPEGLAASEGAAGVQAQVSSTTTRIALGRAERESLCRTACTADPALGTLHACIWVILSLQSPGTVVPSLACPMSDVYLAGTARGLSLADAAASQAIDTGSYSRNAHSPIMTPTPLQDPRHHQ